MTHKKFVFNIPNNLSLIEKLNTRISVAIGLLIACEIIFGSNSIYAAIGIPVAATISIFAPFKLF